MTDDKKPLSPKKYLEEESDKLESEDEDFARFQMSLIGWGGLASILLVIVVIATLFVQHFVFKVPSDNNIYWSGHVVHGWKKIGAIVLSIAWLGLVLFIAIYRINASENRLPKKYLQIGFLLPLIGIILFLLIAFFQLNNWFMTR